MKYLLLFILLLTGCEDKTYSRIYKQESIATPIKKISISESNQTIKSIAQTALLEAGFTATTGSPYSLEIEGTRYRHKCNNPNTATYDATYDGFIKITLLKNMKRIYMCQKDYHGALDKEVLITLIDKMKEDLALLQ